MILRGYESTDAGAWDAFVARAPGGTVCHLSGWMSVVDEVWGHPRRSLVAERPGGEIVGVLPLYYVRTRWFGTMLVSTPNAVTGGILAADAEAEAALRDAACEMARALRVDYLELRSPRGGEARAGFARQELYASFAHPIGPDEDVLMKSFPRDVRRMIRLGERHGLRAEVGREELLDAFYAVYATSVRNLGTPVFPRHLFAAFLRQFPETSEILLVRQGERVAGAVLSFYFRDTVLPYYGGAYPAFHRAGVNNFMYWELMRRAASRGSVQFDFGRSKRGTGAYEFKRGWGMRETPLGYEYYLVRAREMPNLNPLNPKYRLLVQAWKRMPLPLAAWLGPRLVKNFP